MKGRFGSFGIFVCVWVVGCGLAGSAYALHAERHFEMVSPIFKGGFGATKIEAISPDGEAVAFFSPGSYAGAPSDLAILGYLARRGGSGWSTNPLMAPAWLMPVILKSDIEPSLDVTMRLGWPGPNIENYLNEVYLMLHPTGSSDVTGWELGGALKPVNEVLLEPLYRGASSGFCHVLLSSTANEPLTLEGLGVSNQLYQFDRGCSSEPVSVALVGVNNKNKLINPKCYTSLGNEQYSTGGFNLFNTMSADGSEVFFTVCLKTTGDEYGSKLPHQVFVRLGGLKTLEVSRPLGGCVAGGVPGEVPCDGAVERGSSDFAGASEDGSLVYFTTGEQLTSKDTDLGVDLYLAKIGCPQGDSSCGVAEREVTSMAQVSHDPAAGQAADVQGVVRVSPDGTRVYFVAGGDLLDQAAREMLEGEGRLVPRVGAENLYTYSMSSDSLNFIGDLCSGPELSGSIADVRCPSGGGADERLWTNNQGEAQTAGVDGRFLVFASFGELLPSDTNVAQDVYRYDAATDRLVRISGGEGGYDSNGNHTVLNERGEALGAGIAQGHFGGSLLEQYELDNRAISEDGSRVVFVSAEPLSPVASSGQENVYEWHEGPGEGSVSLISNGGFVGPAYEHVAMSPNGLSLFFVTTVGLVPQDRDGAPDVYSARLGEGFPEQPAERRPCESDACQGPLTSPAPLLVPGSVSQASSSNFTAPEDKHKVKKKVKKKAKRRKRSKANRSRAGRVAVGGRR